MGGGRREAGGCRLSTVDCRLSTVCRLSSIISKLRLSIALGANGRTRMINPANPLTLADPSAPNASAPRKTGAQPLRNEFQRLSYGVRPSRANTDHEPYKLPYTRTPIPHQTHALHGQRASIRRWPCQPLLSAQVQYAWASTEPPKKMTCQPALSARVKYAWASTDPPKKRSVLL